MENIKNLASLDLQKYVVKKAGKNTAAQRGMVVKLIPSGSIIVYYYSEIFRKFRYVTFYAVDNMLLMELTNEPKENAYAISKARSTTQTHIAGTAKEQLSRFIGEHKDIKFYNKTKSNPLLYITI